MIKDILNKIINKNSSRKNIYDTIANSIMDGFVDVKVYNDKNGEHELVYHDTGDNTVTDWMRHAIMILLTGSSFSQNGDGRTGLNNGTNDITNSTFDILQYTMPAIASTTSAHTVSDTSKLVGTNYDGYILNGGQYFWNTASYTGHYTASELTAAGLNNYYAVFPTKVLFGTGKEYSSWATLQSENQSENTTWYANMLSEYGGDVGTAATAFDNNITKTTNSLSVSTTNCNVYSGSISNNVYTSTSAKVSRMRTVNDPDTTATLNTSSTMSKNYGVVGAVKTLYFSSTSDSAKIMTSVSESGKLMKPTYRGVGRPCFIYFNTPVSNGVKYEGWSSGDEGVEVSLSRDSAKNYLNKITFSITMPSQTSATNAIGAYYPYNGFTLKQIGLFNDSLLSTIVSADTTEQAKYPLQNMMTGTMMAVKNIAPFTKTADSSVELSWTLTI